jgi:hypothetical protein
MVGGGRQPEKPLMNHLRLTVKIDREASRIAVTSTPTPHIKIIKPSLPETLLSPVIL